MTKSSPPQAGPSIDLKRVDWRGWIAVAWVLFWGFSFCGMVVRARGDRIKDWFRAEKAIVTARESEGLQGAPGPGALTTRSSSSTVASSVQAR